MVFVIIKDLHTRVSTIEYMIHFAANIHSCYSWHNKTVSQMVADPISPLIRAAGQGLEPRSLGPKPSVLPLDDPAIKY